MVILIQFIYYHQKWTGHSGNVPNLFDGLTGQLGLFVTVHEVGHLYIHESWRAYLAPRLGVDQGLDFHWSCLPLHACIAVGNFALRNVKNGSGIGMLARLHLYVKRWLAMALNLWFSSEALLLNWWAFITSPLECVVITAHLHLLIQDRWVMDLIRRHWLIVQIACIGLHLLIFN